MLLQPRKFIFKTRMKRRRISKISRTAHLQYGQSGLQLLQPMRLFNKELAKYKLFTKKAARRVDLTLRKF